MPPRSDAPLRDRPPRSLADWLRGRSDAELEVLVRARPDLVAPMPADSSVLALRVADRHHVNRALDRLDRFTLAVVDALLLLPPPVSSAALTDALGADCGEALARLRALALVWGDPDQVPVSGLAAAVERPAGLGRPAATLLRRVDRVSLTRLLAAHGLPGTGDPDEAAARLSRALPPALGALDAEERAVLLHVDDGGGIGTVRSAWEPASVDDPSPVRRVLARGLLVPVDGETVELPREVGVALRAGRIFPTVSPRPPTLELAGSSRPDLDEAGTHPATETVRLVELLLGQWSARPPAELKSGGLGQRDLKAAAQSLGVDTAAAALLIEAARAAGLVGRTTVLDAHFAPTAAFDAWLREDVGARWAALATGWLGSSVEVGLIGARDEHGKALAPLTSTAHSPAARELRELVLVALADAPPGDAPTRDGLLTRLEWLRPRRAASLRGPALDQVLAQSEALGVTLGGALTSYGRALVAGEDAATALTNALPDPVGHLLLQADLTAIAPGPLEPSLASDLALLADVESPGSATVYRFSTETIRRALDAGWDAASIRGLLERIGRPAVPQALSYLVEDVARRHGQLRVGDAGAYVRCDDEALLAQIVADRQCASLRLHRVAPTVLASAVDGARLLAGLRSAGYAPVAERADGTVTLYRPDEIRAGRAITMPREETTPDAAAARRMVAALRSGDRVAARSPGAPTAGGVTTTLALLEQAVAQARPVLLGYVNAQGQDSRRVVEPERIAGGLLTAYDHRSQERRSFALHRITELQLLEEAGA